jgi:hypothetical protein
MLPVPMYASFRPGDLRPYAAAPANDSLEERTTKLAWGRRHSAMDSHRGCGDDMKLNEVVGDV